MRPLVSPTSFPGSLFSASIVVSTTMEAEKRDPGNEVVVSQVRLNFMGRVSPVCSKSVRNVGTSSAVFSTTERTTRKLRIGRIRREFSCN